MPLVSWDASYSVNVKKVDDQHKMLFAIINRLFEAMRDGQSRTVMETTVKELFAYTQRHFREEEDMMRASGYPSLTAHQAQHRSFEQNVQKFINDVRTRGTANSVQVLQFLNDWLANHIKQTDKQYSAHVNTKGYV